MNIYLVKSFFCNLILLIILKFTNLNKRTVSTNSKNNAAAAAAAAELHNRQESADSGLGMGSNFNLGSIPEDISGMESMETDLDTTLTGDGAQTGVVGQTTTGVCGAEDRSATGMDATDGLMPSLQVSA